MLLLGPFAVRPKELRRPPLKNPLTGIGKIVDVVLELWAIGVVTAVAGRLLDVLR